MYSLLNSTARSISRYSSTLYRGFGCDAMTTSCWLSLSHAPRPAVALCHRLLQLESALVSAPATRHWELTLAQTVHPSLDPSPESQQESSRVLPALHRRELRLHRRSHSPQPAAPVTAVPDRLP